MKAAHIYAVIILYAPVCLFVTFANYVKTISKPVTILIFPIFQFVTLYSLAKFQFIANKGHNAHGLRTIHSFQLHKTTNDSNLAVTITRWIIGLTYHAVSANKLVKSVHRP